MSLCYCASACLCTCSTYLLPASPSFTQAAAAVVMVPSGTRNCAMPTATHRADPPILGELRAPLRICCRTSMLALPLPSRMPYFLCRLLDTTFAIWCAHPPK
ncbi:hypothetical protein B0T16DRAFT_76002 [Cercophora newfieldiana]|uniref:Uncharacterized protein n=1 Tax=Cercophora newfieldiana TaxID=92897 RepID=A0AA39YEP3_9PEZI|nr:hypothetical protein B0T16DRAFT_76002 [Cercophora newfieldiana]